MVNIQNNSVYGFSRLKHHFQSGLNMPQYDKAISTAKNTTVGNLPNDLLNIVLAANPANKGDAIKSVQEAFKNTSSTLTQFDRLQKEALSRVTPNGQKAAEIFEDNGAFFIDETYNKEMKKLTSAAGETLLKGMSQFVPNLGKVNVKPLGFGSYAQTFKFEFLDNDGNKIISDKVMKLFRQESDFAIEAMKTAAKVLNSAPLDEITKEVQKSRPNIQKSHVEQAKTMYSELVQMKDALEKVQKAQIMHGAAAETNASEYIKHFAGHKTLIRNGIAIPYMSHLGKDSFMISEFVGDNMGANSIFPFKRLGLQHTDLEMNPANTVNGVCVDLGGILPTLSLSKLIKLNTENIDFAEANRIASKSVIAGDKFLMRKLKKFMDIPTPEGKNKYLETLQEEANNTRNMIEKRKINDFIAEVKEKYSDDLIVDYKFEEEEVDIEKITPEVAEMLKDILE